MTAVELLTAAVVGSGAAALAGLLLRGGLARVRSLRAQVLVLTFASLSVGTAVAFVLSARMVLDADEARMVASVMALTAGFATALVVVASIPLGRDVRRLERTVRAVETGDRRVRTDVHRADELGHVATALDDLVARLDELERARALEDERRSAMFASVSHDLRTPLSALRAAIEAMEDGLTPDPDRYLRSMQRDVEALSALVDDLFLLARIESGTLEMPPARVDLGEIVDEAVEALAPAAAAHDVALVVAASGRTMVVGNAVALGRVVRNLLDNAIRHSPARSTVTIAVEAGARPVVRVVDQGSGFPAGFRGAAFERFTRSDASRSRATGGAGLGLAIAHGLVTAHGGEIWIDDADTGSVAFALPAPA